jgi:antitoxin component of MazEF toxin-antitoxin module
MQHLHLSEDTVVAVGCTEDDTYLIPRTLGEKEEYDQDHLEQVRAHEAEQANERRDDGCPSMQHLDAEGAQARALCMYDQTNKARGRCPSFLEPVRMSQWMP